MEWQSKGESKTFFMFLKSPPTDTFTRITTTENQKNTGTTRREIWLCSKTNFQREKHTAVILHILGGDVMISEVLHTIVARILVPNDACPSNTPELTPYPRGTVVHLMLSTDPSMITVLSQSQGGISLCRHTF